MRFEKVDSLTLEASAQLYILSNILHDWPDTQASIILRHVRRKPSDFVRRLSSTILIDCGSNGSVLSALGHRSGLAPIYIPDGAPAEKRHSRPEVIWRKARSLASTK